MIQLHYLRKSLLEIHHHLDNSYQKRRTEVMNLDRYKFLDAEGSNTNQKEGQGCKS